MNLIRIDFIGYGKLIRMTPVISGYTIAVFLYGYHIKHARTKKEIHD